MAFGPIMRAAAVVLMAVLPLEQASAREEAASPPIPKPAGMTDEALAHQYAEDVRATMLAVTCSSRYGVDRDWVSRMLPLMKGFFDRQVTDAEWRVQGHRMAQETPLTANPSNTDCMAAFERFNVARERVRVLLVQDSEIAERQKKEAQRDIQRLEALIRAERQEEDRQRTLRIEEALAELLRRTAPPAAER